MGPLVPGTGLHPGVVPGTRCLGRGLVPVAVHGAGAAHRRERAIGTGSCRAG